LLFIRAHPRNPRLVSCSEKHFDIACGTDKLVAVAQDEDSVLLDEADWNKRFQDPERMARFVSWSEKSLETDDAPKPLDASAL
jgi:hypothetical protein